MKLCTHSREVKWGLKISIESGCVATGGVPDAGLQPTWRLPIAAGRQLAGHGRGVRCAADGRHAQPGRHRRTLGCHERRGDAGGRCEPPAPGSARHAAASNAPPDAQHSAAHQQHGRPGRQRGRIPQRLLRLRPHALQRQRRQGEDSAATSTAFSWSYRLLGYVGSAATVLLLGPCRSKHVPALPLAAAQ